ncbi:MAG: hypothetical protein ACFWUD_05830 [Thermocaproicibacter melissae]|jgi:hypothetical protein
MAFLYLLEIANFIVLYPDLNVFDEELNLKMVIAKGKIPVDRRA